MSEQKIGISGAGVALPYHRIKVAAIRDAWDNTPESVAQRLGVVERGVIDPDADVVTLAIEAGHQALEGVAPESVGAVFLGTQSGPYVDRANAAIVAEALLCGLDTFATDVQFSGKSGTSALLAALAFVRAGMADAALAIGADAIDIHVAPGDPAELTASCGAAALLVTRSPTLAQFEAHSSVSSDTPDSFRLDGERYIRNTGAVMTATGVGELAHVRAAWERLGAKLAWPTDGIAHLACHQRDGAGPGRLAKALGLGPNVTKAGMIADRLGDAGAAAPLLSLIRVLDLSQAGDHAVLIAYGAGAGADALAFQICSSTVTPRVESKLRIRKLIDYATAVRFERRYHGHERPSSAFE
ncbi:MAG: hydroxymethylglutaryl-CoA synthase [Hyphomonadaceae bacterium]|nr:hydroxymethylglutaryl-CoA synthase [Hyphomonadaceae bacterium]GIK50158.1 MAG: hydroxymethylglutaryl-CoA synthase [Alphaproteobacteria bacterium]